MKSAFLSAALLVAAPSAWAQSQNLTFLTGLLTTLQSANLTSLISATSTFNSSGVGQGILGDLSSGSPFVLFAPSNEAFASAPSNVTSDSGRLTDVLAYHIVSGNFSNSATTYPNVTLGRTFLNDSEVVQLEGNKAQVVAWAIRADGHIHVLNQRNDSTVVNTTSFGNITINIVDHVLIPPESLQQTVPTENATTSLTQLNTFLGTVNVPFFNSTSNSSGSISAFNLLNSGLHGFTFFAPNDSAIFASQSNLTALASNTTALNNLFYNHLINDTTVYSPQLVGQNFTSAGGEPLTFSINATGQYVTSGNTTALITQPDVLLSNGVLHVIDRVLINTGFNSGAASSALASATSAAAQSTTESQPIGFSATASLSSGVSGSGASASGSNSAAVGRFAGPGKAQMVALGATAVGVLMGALITVF
ncbi:FAS1 domain-containing protein [Obba rivulosa]|uniref:FAS1 domain-containing protein n=1 Tax=Obba rivulosa TaxID=1052685 RepID=A0A8E2APJ4_9APHY|nr:FAS1 domain-containing protein [Obba rivulosa]